MAACRAKMARRVTSLAGRAQQLSARDKGFLLKGFAALAALPFGLIKNERVEMSGGLI